jgi:hypothetical protein
MRFPFRPFHNPPFTPLRLPTFGDCFQRFAGESDEEAFKTEKVRFWFFSRFIYIVRKKAESGRADVLVVICTY